MLFPERETLEVGTERRVANTSFSVGCEWGGLGRAKEWGNFHCQNPVRREANPPKRNRISYVRSFHEPRVKSLDNMRFF